MSRLQIKKKKNHHFEVSSSHATQQEQIISWSDCDIWWKVHFIWQQAMTSSVVGLRRNSKALPEAKYSSEKCHDHCLVVCCQSDQLRLSESWRNHYIWEVCFADRWDAPKTAKPAAWSQHWSTERAALQCLTACSTTNASKAQWINEVLLHPPLDLLSTDDHFFKHHNFLQGKCFHNQHKAENAFQDFTESWGTDFYATGINKFIFHWKKCVDCNGSYLNTKDVFEPSYDLKFVVQNHSCICTNLIAVCHRSVPWFFWTCLAMQLCVIEVIALNDLEVFGIEKELHKSYYV